MKYLFKYIFKDQDRTMVALKNRNNKIKFYLPDQYIGPIEAVWHIMGFRSYWKTLPVTRLQVHEEGW